VALVCLAVGIAGCGGSSAKDRFQSQGNQICREMNSRIASAPGSQRLALGREEIRRLSALAPPPELGDKLSAYLASESDYYRRAEEAIARRDAAAANALNPHQDDQLARDLGLTACG
jgi:hypothetical protein